MLEIRNVILITNFNKYWFNCTATIIIDDIWAAKLNMKKIQSITLVLLCLMNISCERGVLSNIELAAKTYKQCLSEQVYPDECSENLRTLEIKELEGKQKGIERDKIEASRELGYKRVSRWSGNSPYERVTRSLKKYNITPLSDNYFPYKESCLNYNKEDFVNRLMAISEKDRSYQLAAFFKKSPTETFIFYKTSPPQCRPESFESINDEFPLITENQLERLKNGEYSYTKSKPKVHVYDTFEEAIEINNEIWNKD